MIVSVVELINGFKHFIIVPHKKAYISILNGK